MERYKFTYRVPGKRPIPVDDPTPYLTTEQQEELYGYTNLELDQITFTLRTGKLIGKKIKK